MSDAKIPEQNPDSNQPAPATPSSWFAGWEEFSTAPEAHAQSDGDLVDQSGSALNASAQIPPPTAADVWDEWQTVDFPNVLSAAAIERPAQVGDRHHPVPAAHPVARTIPPEASPDTWTENSAHPDLQPDIGELISLIQELNQCNNALLDRVSQLEDALEQTQNATLAENAHVIQAIAPDSDDLHTLHGQVRALSSQLDLSQQISQRQQILATTLAQELEASQARVTQLEQEYALSQQRLNEQAHLLIQSESDCRDLRTRLQRQQRHTLQFKAALERCLDVPVDLAEALTAGVEAATQQPWYEPQSNLAVQSLLPKVQQIQPWSAKSGGSSVPLKLDALLSRSSEQADEPLANLQDLQADAASAAPSTVAEDAATTVEAAADTPFPSAKLPGLPTLDQRANSMAVGLPNSPSPLGSEANMDSKLEENGELSDTFTPSSIPSVNDIIKTLIAPNAGSDAEAALWQDLARLVNGSTDDLPQTNWDQQNVGRNEAATASHPAQNISHSAPQHTTDTSPVPASETEPQSKASRKSAIAGPLPIPPLVPTPAATDRRKLLEIPFESSAWLSQVSQSPQSAAIAPERGAAPEVSTPVNPEDQGPSPLVYPERPAKKIQSLAAVDLPSFPR